MMTDKTLADILGDFNTVPDEKGRSLAGGGRPVTLWLPSDAKTRYDRLQERSGRKFSKKAREAIIALIAAAEAREAG